jgi:hypothetical protein
MKRSDLFDRAQKIRNEIAQIFDDARHWNSLHPGEEIDPDPDGSLVRAAARLDTMLAGEKS